MITLTYSVICEPRMVETLLCTEPLLSAQYQQGGDEIFGVIRNFVKIWHVKGVLTFQCPGHGPVPRKEMKEMFSPDTPSCSADLFPPQKGETPPETRR